MEVKINKKLVSVIIRTKNEEKWIGHCLKSVFSQSISDIEVIVVDNQSTDKTLELVSNYPVKVVEIERYRPGLSLNEGIRQASGEYVVCLSSHCIPKHDLWLEKLLRNFESDEAVGGVYGRQVPVKYSSDSDKRDLLISFGLDRRVQVKDSFFHNANSAFPRALWEEFPFNEEMTNIEDRAWAQTILDQGYKIIYEPEAEVYHHHGIHHGMSRERCESTVRVLESIHSEEMDDIPHSMRPENANVVAFISIIGPELEIGRVNLLERAVKELQDCVYVDDVCVIADDQNVLRHAHSLGAVAIERGEDLLQPGNSIETSLSYALSAYEKQKEVVDAAVFMNYQFPFRPKNFFKELIEEFVATGVDSTIAATPNYSVFWVEDDDGYASIGNDFRPREEKSPIYRGIWGLGGVSAGHVIRSGALLGEKINLVKINEELYSIKAEGEFWETIAQILLEREESEKNETKVQMPE